MSSMRKVSAKKGKKNRRSEYNTRSTASAPGTIETGLVCYQTLRFISTAGGAFSINTIAAGPTPLSGVMVATSATALTSLFDAFKIKRIRLWGPPPSSLVPVTIDVVWVAPTGGNFPMAGSDRHISDTSMGSTRAAFIETKPPKGSYVADWLSNNSNTTVFAGTVPANTILDVDLVYRRDVRSAGPGAQAQTVAGAVTGAIYREPIDATSIFTPLGALTI